MRQFLILLALFALGVPALAQDDDEEKEELPRPVQRALNIGADALLYEDGWLVTASETETMATVTWVNGGSGGLASGDVILEAFELPDSAADVYDTGYFDVVFEQYDSYKLTALCQKGKVFLTEVEVIFGGEAYSGRYWTRYQPDVLERLLLLLPADGEGFEELSEALYPELPSCVVEPDESDDGATDGNDGANDGT
jgi:hypothetical protein